VGPHLRNGSKGKVRKLNVRASHRRRHVKQALTGRKYALTGRKYEGNVGKKYFF
jgi:hypothetical protein